MRIIAGEFRSRKLLSVEGVGTRPTSDRMRETLFNIIGPAIEGAIFVDAYAGTGAVGMEALSRGAKLAVFLETERRALEAIRANLKSLRAEGRARVIAGAAGVHLGKLEPDILFVDPPYAEEQEYRMAMETKMASPPRLAILQHSIRFVPDEDYGSLHRYRLVRQGDNALSFYRTS
jgi:16S rRNA (guanine966-N2)-methyltransferase